MTHPLFSIPPTSIHTSHLFPQAKTSLLKRSRCLKDFNIIKHGSPESSVSRKIFSDHWNVAVAPNAGDILWDHLSVDPESWWARALIINIVLFIFVLFVTTPTVMIAMVYQIKTYIRKYN
jgi:hypothetical protein